MAAEHRRRLLVAGLDNDLNLRRLERYLAVAWASGVTPGRRPQQGRPRPTTSTGGSSRSRPIAPGRRDGRGLGADRRRARRAPRAPAPGTTAASSARRASASRRSSTPCSARTARRRPRSARTTRAAATRRPTASCSSCPAARCSSTRPGMRALEVLGADEGVEPRSTTSTDLAAALPVQRLPPRRRAGLRGPRRARRRAPDRGPAREPAQARARAGPRRARGRPARPRRAPPHVEDHPQVRRRAHGAQIRRRPMTTTSQIRPLERAGIPPIDGIRARYFADPSDYARLATLFGAANQADDVPWVPTAQQLQLEFDGDDGADPVHDVVLAEVDGRLVAATGVDRALRDGVPTYELWGAVDPGVSAARPRHVADGLDARSCARARLARGPARAGQPRRLRRGHRGRSSRAARRDRASRRSATSSSCAAPLDEPIPDAPLPDGLEIRPVAEDALADDLGRRERGVPRPLGSPREGRDLHFKATFAHAELDTEPVGRRLGRRPGRRRGPELDLARGERGARRQPRLARAHQRPPAVAPPRPRPRAHRGVAGHAPRARARRGACSASIRRTRTARSGCTRGSGSPFAAARRPTGGRWSAERPAPPTARSCLGSRAASRQAGPQSG